MTKYIPLLTTLFLGLLWLGVTAASTPGKTADDALPELEPFLQEVKRHLRSDRLLRSQYTFKEKETVHELNKKGEIKKTTVKVYEVFPSLEEEMTYRRLISENGEPVSEKKLQKQDRKHQKKLEKRRKKLAREGQSEREKRLEKEAEEQDKEDKIIDEMFSLYDFSLEGRDSVEACRSVVVDFSPRRDFKTKSKEIKFLKKIKGRAWVCEEDHQLIRLEAEMIESASWGLGVFGKLYEGTHFSFQRRRINEEIWLPAELQFEGSGRVVFFKFRVEGGSEYWDYKKFTVDSSITYHP